MFVTRDKTSRSEHNSFVTQAQVVSSICRNKVAREAFSVWRLNVSNYSRYNWKKLFCFYFV